MRVPFPGASTRHEHKWNCCHDLLEIRASRRARQMAGRIGGPPRPAVGTTLFRGRALDPELLHPATKGIGVHAENSRGARWALDHLTM